MEINLIKNYRKKIYLIGFLFSVSLALNSYINSSFLEQYLGRNNLGFVFSFASLLTILGMLSLPKILNSFGNRLTFIIFNTLSLLALLFLSFTSVKIIALLAFIIYFICTNFIIASLDIFVEDFSENKHIGKFRGLYLSIMSFAWILAQIILSFTLKGNDFSKIYLLSAFFAFLVSIFTLFNIKKFKDPHYTKISIIKTITTFFKNKNISKIYFINLILRFFFSWMVIYTPIYLHEFLNFTWDKIGIIFTLMLIPFVILDFPLGKMSDRIGEKKILLIGFIITIISTLSIPFIQEPKLLIWATILFLTRVGAATIEVMSESYFFKIVNEKNADEISFFRNTNSVSYIIAPLLAIPILIFIPSFKYLFLILGVVLLLGFYISLKLKDIK